MNTQTWKIQRLPETNRDSLGSSRLRARRGCLGDNVITMLWSASGLLLLLHRFIQSSSLWDAAGDQPDLHGKTISRRCSGRNSRGQKKDKAAGFELWLLS